MLSVKLVRSLVLGETITTTTTTNDDNNHHNNNINDNNNNNNMMINQKNKKKMPMLLFIPTRELISDTFRLATICRDLGMNFHPSQSLSHLLFSWPSSMTSLMTSSSSSNVRNSTSSQSSMTSSSISISISNSISIKSVQNDGVPIPFPSLSTNSSISLLRSFVAMSKGLFKLVFFDVNPNSGFNPNYYHTLLNYEVDLRLSLFSRVSGKRVKSIDDLSFELAGKGWSFFRTTVKSVENSVYLFRKIESNRVRFKVVGGGEDRVRELRLPAIDFQKGVQIRVLLYILLMTEDVFYLA